MLTLKYMKKVAKYEMTYGRGESPILGPLPKKVYHSSTQLQPNEWYVQRFNPEVEYVHRRKYK